ncbi:zinc finger protein ZIC 2-like isoform X2 [Branchiostoma floridae]|uniref:Zinc finger protein ZIC 2-like isoform X2 n=1 Tax=Branchiostoma floridae TaxID=7739 RepID=A0A9J7HUE3_BRAFL|nr:zinc finger protein ZIC 2-like isoform X2 [Branchiostoma floridae]
MASSYFNILGFRKDVSVVWRRRETDPAAVDADHADVRVVPGPRARPAPVNHADDPCRGRSSSATRTGFRGAVPTGGSSGADPLAAREPAAVGARLAVRQTATGVGAGTTAGGGCAGGDAGHGRQLAGAGGDRGAAGADKG